MKLPYDLIVLDLEFDKDNVIEIGAVKILRDFTFSQNYPNNFGGIIRQSDNYIASQHFTNLTGITQDMIMAGDSKIDILEGFKKWTSKETSNVVLACWGDDAIRLNKMYEMVYEISPFRNKFMEISSILRWMNCIRGIKCKDGLDDNLKQWGLEFESAKIKPEIKMGNRHRALDDAFNTARLLVKAASWVKQLRDTIGNLQKEIGVV